MRNFIFISTFVVPLCCVLQHVNGHADHSLLLLISFDGFRWDYLQKVKKADLHTPNFDLLVGNGVTLSEPGLTNVFPTDTFVNHYSIVTGMYPENHGVVSNYMFDPKTKETFFVENKDDNLKPNWFSNGTLEEGEKYHGPQPIWNLNQKYGSSISKKRSGVMFWPGSEAAIGGDHPEHCEHYNSSLANQKRIDMIVNWFATEDKPINLGLLYFEDPDSTGHKYGPDSGEILSVIVQLDQLIGYLIQQLKATHLFEKMNIIITSDHGMTALEQTIVMNKYLNSSWYEQYGESPVWNILPKVDNEKVYDVLKTVPHLNVYYKEDVPREYHYTYNRRILPIVIEAEKGYRLCLTNDTSCEALSFKGDHGYNNSLPSMHPIFIGHGPAFKKNFTGQPFNTVDLLPLMCHILQIKTPGNIDGSIERAEHVLFVDDMGRFVTGITVVSSVVFAALISLLCCIGVCRLFCRLQGRIYNKRVLVPLNQISSDGAIPLLDSDEFD